MECYDYQNEKKYVFTTEGAIKLLDVWEKAKKLSEVSGCFNAAKLIIHKGDSWEHRALVDFLIENHKLYLVSDHKFWEKRVLELTT